MKKKNGTHRPIAQLTLFLVLLALCAGLGACATTQVRGQYDIAIGTARY